MYVRLLLALLCALGCATLVEASPFAYVAIYNGQRVAVVDTNSNSKIKDVLLPTSANPYGVAVNNFGSRVYVSDRMGTKIYVIDTSDDSVRTFNVPYRSSGLAVNAAGTRLYVAHPENASLSVLNAVDGTLIKTVSSGTSPQGVAVNQAGDRVFVANSALGAGDTNHYVSVYVATDDSMASAGTANVDSTPMGIALNPTGTRLYVACADSGTVNVVDTSNNQTVGTINVGTIPFGIAVNPAGTFAYVTLSGTDDKVAIIDTSNNTVQTTKISVGRSPMGISITPDGTRIVAANSLSASAALINPATNTVVSTVSVEKNAGDNSNPQSLGNFVGPELVPVNFPVPFNGSVTPSDPITVDATNVAYAPKGRDLLLSVVPDTNFSVGQVLDGATALTPPYKLTNVVSERSISASFTRVSRTLTVYKGENGDVPEGGRVWTSEPASPTIDCGTSCSSVSRTYGLNVTIVLNATPEPGYFFQGWGGAGCSGNKECRFTTNGINTDIQGNYLVKAFFYPSLDTSFQALYDAATGGSALACNASYTTEPTTSFVAGSAKTVTINPASPSTTISLPAPQKFTVQYGQIIIGTGGTFIIK